MPKGPSMGGTRVWRISAGGPPGRSGYDPLCVPEGRLVSSGRLAPPAAPERHQSPASVRRLADTASDSRSLACFLPVVITKGDQTRVKTAELIDQVASAVEKSAAKKAVDAVFAGIVEAAKQGDEVNLAGFGKFKVKDSPARQGRNPATGERLKKNRHLASD